jgi:tetratricopeptide (TPR) repeat protein
VALRITVAVSTFRHRPVRCLIANAHVQMEKTDEALADFNPALALDPKNLPALIGNADLDYGSRRLLESSDDYAHRMAIQPNNADFAFKRGNVYFDLHGYAAAIRDYSVSLNLDSRQPDMLRNRAKALEHLGAKQDAERDRKRATAVDP